MERENGLSGSALKMIAIITMLIDHLGAIVLARVILSDRAGGSAYIELYGTMRFIGRIAFPIFCFLLVQGVVHTRNKAGYAMRLGVFALISEIPYDLALSGTVLEFGNQNVFFTLFIGLLVMAAYHYLEEQAGWNRIVCTLCQIAIIFAGMWTAEVLHTDYAGRGVLCIMVLYVFRQNKLWQIILGCFSFIWWEMPALLAFIPIAFYNGKRGWNIKYLFYIFYPAHLLVLYLISWGMGISGVPAM